MLTEKTENLILKLLKKIQKDQSDMRQSIQELTVRMGNSESYIALLHNDFIGLSGRIDGLAVKIERIDKRLELTDS